MGAKPARRARPIFSQLNVVSGDLAASVEFYRRLGVSIPPQSLWRTSTGAHHVNVKNAASAGGVELEFDSPKFARAWNAGWNRRDDLRGRVVIGFRMASRAAVDRRYAALTGAGYAGLQAPHDAFWGSRYAIVEDPDGIAVGLMSPASAKFRSHPPDV